MEPKIKSKGRAQWCTPQCLRVTPIKIIKEENDSVHLRLLPRIPVTNHILSLYRPTSYLPYHISFRFKGLLMIYRAATLKRLVSLCSFSCKTG